MAYILIAYSPHDAEFAHYLHDLLQGESLAVWMEPEQESPEGERWSRTQNRMTGCTAALAIMSSAAREDGWVERQIDLADSLDTRVFPVLLEGEVWPRFRDVPVDEMTGGINAPLPDRLKLMLFKTVSTDTQTVPLRPVDGSFEDALREIDAAPANGQWQVIVGVGVVLVLIAVILLLARL